MQKKNLNSIFKINYLILLLIFFINYIFYFFEWIYHLKNFFLTINFIFLCLFLLSNFLYLKEYNRWKWNIKELINSNFLESEELKNTLFQKMKYKENDEFYSLFKNFFIRKNIIKKDYKDLKDVFYKMVPEHFVNEVGENWIERIWLWISIKKNLNVMFLDIIWFTSIAEKLPQDRALLLLNIYFDWIVEIIKINWWYVDKFLWDWMMIVFEWEETDSIIKTSIEIQNFISKFQVSDIWKKINIWIWINSWEVILWTIWSKKRMEITLIWDVVNTASRLEWLSRIFKEKIIIWEQTYNSIKNKNIFSINYLWLKELKWKKQKIKIYWVETLLNIKI